MKHKPPYRFPDIDLSLTHFPNSIFTMIKEHNTDSYIEMFVSSCWH